PVVNRCIGLTRSVATRLSPKNSAAARMISRFTKRNGQGGTSLRVQSRRERDGLSPTREQNVEETMGHSVRGFGLAAAMLLAFNGSAFSAEKLVLGNEGSYPPFSMVDASGKLTGFEPELAREMCKRMGVECEIVVMDFKGLIPALLGN